MTNKDFGARSPRAVLIGGGIAAALVLAGVLAVAVLIGRRNPDTSATEAGTSADATSPGRDDADKAPTASGRGPGEAQTPPPAKNAEVAWKPIRDAEPIGPVGRPVALAIVDRVVETVVTSSPGETKQITHEPRNDSEMLLWIAIERPVSAKAITDKRIKQFLGIRWRHRGGTYTGNGTRAVTADIHRVKTSADGTAFKGGTRIYALYRVWKDFDSPRLRWGQNVSALKVDDAVFATAVNLDGKSITPIGSPSAIAAKPKAGPAMADVREKTFNTEKRTYFIWREDDGPVKSRTLHGLGPTPRPWLPVGVDFYLNPKSKPVPFAVRLEIVARDTRGRAVCVTQTISQKQEPGQGLKEGKAVGMFLPKEHTLSGKGKATVYLVRTSQQGSNADGAISNKLVVPFTFEP